MNLSATGTPCRNRPRNEAGGTLLVTLLMAVVIGMTLASYLTLVSAHNRAVMRSQAWNAALPVVEAGIEEALTQLHECGLTNLSRNGWEVVQPGPEGRFLKRRSLGASRYEVAIFAHDPPLIQSTGYEPAPLSPDGIPIRRRVECETERDFIFTHAMLAKVSIDLRGGQVSTDSFDSSDPLYSTGFKYDPAKKRDGGDIAALKGLQLGNAKVAGKVVTSPDGALAKGPGSSAGSTAWLAAGKTGVEPGWSSSDLNVDIPAATLPNLPWQVAYSGNTRIGDLTFNYVLGNAAYKITSFKGNVYVAGKASVYVPVDGTFDITGNDGIHLAPGASLNLYVGAPAASLSGKGLVNQGTALDFAYWGLETNTKLSLSGNAGFIGSIYAPSADLHLSGSGNDKATDLTGASVTKTVTMTGGFNFHYDEALTKNGPFRGYVVTSWNEVAVP